MALELEHRNTTGSLEGSSDPSDEVIHRTRRKSRYLKSVQSQKDVERSGLLDLEDLSDEAGRPSFVDDVVRRASMMGLEDGPVTMGLAGEEESLPPPWTQVSDMCRIAPDLGNPLTLLVLSGSPRHHSSDLRLCIGAFLLPQPYHW